MLFTKAIVLPDSKKRPALRQTVNWSCCSSSYSWNFSAEWYCLWL